MKSTLWLVRHAQPDVGDGICYGRTDLSVMPEANAIAAHKLAQELNRECSHRSPSYRVYTSGLARADALASALQTYFSNVDIQQDQRLREMDFGEWEMCRWNAIPKIEFDNWITRFGTYQFGGVESCQQVLSRVIAAFRDVQSELAELARRGEDQQVLWITHAGVIRALTYFLATGNEHIQESRQWPIYAPDFGEWIIVPVD